LDYAHAAVEVTHCIDRSREVAPHQILRFDLICVTLTHGPTTALA